MSINELYFQAEQTKLDPILCGSETCAPGHSWGPAVRIYWLIHYVVSGKGIFRIGGKEYTVSAGSFFVISPFEETYYQADTHDPWKYIWVGFTCSGNLPLSLDPVVICPDVYEHFRGIADCAYLSGGRKAFLTARLWDLFAYLLENRSPSEDRISQAVNYIHSKYMNPLSVEDMARRVNLERSYFTTLFTRQIGISPGRYLQNYRMEIAASLLTQGGKSVSLTAQSVGYSDIYTFSKTFKRHFGLSPREFAKQNEKPLI